MGSTEGGTFVFICPECGESLEVNAAMRDVLIDRGCVICGAGATSDAFVELQSTDTC